MITNGDTFIDNRVIIIDDRCLAGSMAMHACQIGPTDTAPPARDRHYGPAVGQRGELLMITICSSIYDS